MLRKRNRHTTKERRKEVRLEESLSVIRCPSKFLLENNCLSRDISEDGICLLSQRKIDIGETIKLGIYVPELKNPVIAVGQVMRRNSSDNIDFPFILGIKFIKISPSAYEQIRNHVRYYFLKT